MMNFAAGLVVFGLIAPNPLYAQGIRIGSALPSRPSLPSYPVPVTSIGRPAVQLPSPVLPIPSLPNPARPGVPVISLPTPATVPVARLLPEAVVLRATLPASSAGSMVQADPLPRSAIGPQQYPRISPASDPLPVPVPTTLKSKFSVASNSIQKVTANLTALFDNAEKPAPAPVPADDQTKPEIKEERESYNPSERRITLPEWELENEIGVNSTEPNW